PLACGARQSADECRLAACALQATGQRRNTMNRLSISQIAEFASAKLESGDGTVPVERISTDSRTIKPNELFVALRGENFDGHKFVEAVAKAGAAGAMVDLAWRGKVPKDFAIIRANDTLLAYQTL